MSGQNQDQETRDRARREGNRGMLLGRRFNERERQRIARRGEESAGVTEENPPYHRINDDKDKAESNE